MTEVFAQTGDCPFLSCSPLEWLMERHLCVAMQRSPYGQGKPWSAIYMGLESGPFADFPPLWTAGVAVGREVPVAGYSADFGIIARAKNGKPAKVAIECDGHNFHERTEKQAAHDRARDRTFANLGIWTVRYTGAEIRANPERCAAEAISIALKRSLP